MSKKNKKKDDYKAYEYHSGPSTALRVAEQSGLAEKKNGEQLANPAANYGTSGTPQTIPPAPVYIAPATKGAPKYRNRFAQYVRSSIKLTFKYFFAQAIACLIMGVAAWLAFTAFGIPAPVMWATIIALSNYIPVIGQWIGSPVVLLGIFIATGEWRPVLFALIVIVVLQALDDFLIAPLIIGRSLSFKPILIIAITLAAGALIGGWGVLLAIPIAACIKLAYEIFYLKKDVDNTIAGKNPTPDELPKFKGSKKRKQERAARKAAKKAKKAAKKNPPAQNAAQKNEQLVVRK